MEGGVLLDNTRLRDAIESRDYTGFGYAAKVERAGRDYRPDVGFELRDDFTVEGVKLWQGWGPRPGSPVARHQVLVGSGTYLRNADDTVETVETTLSWEGVFTSSAVITGGVDVTYDDLQEGFSLSDDVEVLPGAYTFAFAHAGYEMPGGRAVRTDVDAGAGTFYDGRRWTTSVSPKWVISKHLTLSGSYEFNRIGFPDRDQAFTAHVGRLKVQAALDTQWSLSSFLQLSSASRAGLADLRLRFNPHEGSDLYLVVNWGFNAARLNTSPAQPFTNQRTVLVKYTYTFAL